jgi:hypothetical protein
VATSLPGAELFAAFLNQDFASAAEHQLAQPAEIAATVSDARAKLATETNPPPPPLAKATTASLVPAKVFSYGQEKKQQEKKHAASKSSWCSLPWRKYMTNLGIAEY